MKISQFWLVSYQTFFLNLLFFNQEVPVWSMKPPLAVKLWQSLEIWNSEICIVMSVSIPFYEIRTPRVVSELKRNEGLAATTTARQWVWRVV